VSSKETVQKAGFSRLLVVSAAYRKQISRRFGVEVPEVFAS